MPVGKNLSAEEKARRWQLWHEGKSHHEIARTLDITPVSVFLFLRNHGGIEPRIRARSLRHLSLEERESISRALSSGVSYRSIATELGRSVSTISREVARNGGRIRYRAARADKQAWKHGHRPKCCRLVEFAKLQRLVSKKLALKWSPEQIALWLQDEFPDQPELHVSHETIYKSLYIQSRGALKKELREHLRTQRRFRQSRHKTRKGHSGSIVDGLSIRERPAEIEDRAVPGHWEGDLIQGSDQTFIATLVERKTRFVVLVKVRSKHTEVVTKALVKQIKKLPDTLLRTLTWDQGSEMAAHKRFAMDSEMDVYFCDPGSPWQRGSNENTNGLLRQYFPKGTDLSRHTQAQLNTVAMSLNTRPRKTLNAKTPAFMLNLELNTGVALTG
jgi:IS30 family transposase